MVNSYDANTENEQIDVLRSLFELLEEFDTNPTKQIVMAGDFNLLFNSKLHAQYGNPTLKMKSLAKLTAFKDTDIWSDIWRVRNTKYKRFSFTQKHSSGFIQLRLDCILNLNTLQEFVTMAEILISVSTDYNLILLSFSKEKN